MKRKPAISDSGKCECRPPVHNPAGAKRCVKCWGLLDKPAIHRTEEEYLADIGEGK